MGGGVAVGKRAHAGAGHPVAVPRREAGMSTPGKRAGPWSPEGPGVLAREQDLVLLSSLADSGLVDKLLDLLAETAGSGGDGLQFARAVEDVLDADGAWRLWQEGHEGPALV